MGHRKKTAAQRIAPRPDQHAASGRDWSLRAFTAIALGLSAATFVAYSYVLKCGFVQIDDPSYVFENPMVQGGLTLRGVDWAMTALTSANWHPLTWISLMLDRQIYGIGPMGYHLTNLLLHIANTVLLLLVLTLMTKSLWKSAVVAALFALHPLHVESVAWISERKDVLSTFFWMLTMLAYWRYSRRPGIGGYALVVVLLALGLTAKPMLVSLPLMLLLMDWWPLGRFKGGSPWKLILEKVPLILLTAASSVVTMIAQRHGSAIIGLEELPLVPRLGNAVFAYTEYLAKVVWPAGLSFFYTPTHMISASQAMLLLLVLILISLVAMRLGKRRPYLAVGWLWYVITLVPVIGIVQVGAQCMADRYTYVPLIGIFIMLAWGVPGSMGAWGYGRMGAQDSHTPRRPHSHTSLFAAVSLIVVAALGMCTARQVGYWRDDESLCGHAVRIDPMNFIAYDMLGAGLAKQGRLAEAVDQFEAALRIQPRHAQTNNNIGIALAGLGRYDEAVLHYKIALRGLPNYREAHGNLGLAYEQMGKTDDAIAEYSRALALDPRLAGIHNHVGDLLALRKEYGEAIRHFELCLEIEPANTQARLRLALALFCHGDYARAWEQIHVLRQYGSDAPYTLLDALSSKMPDPGT
jgi:protein O-mannosyl-transferase